MPPNKFFRLTLQCFSLGDIFALYRLYEVLGLQICTKRGDQTRVPQRLGFVLSRELVRQEAFSYDIL